MKKGAILLTTSIIGIPIVFAQEQTTQSLSLVFLILSIHTILLLILIILFVRLHRHHIPELFKTTKQEIDAEKVAHTNHYSEHAVEILHKYISYYSRHGYNVKQLREELEKQGYHTNDINEAIKRYTH